MGLNIIFTLIGLIFGASIVLLVFKIKILNNQNLSADLNNKSQRIQELSIELADLSNQKNIINDKIIENEKKLTNTIEKLNANHIELVKSQAELDSLEAQKTQYIDITIPQLKQQAETTYETNMQLMNERFDTAIEKLHMQLEANVNECNTTYLELLAEAKEEYVKQVKLFQQECDEKSKELNRLRAIVQAGVADNKRAAEIASDASRYTISITSQALVEVKLLREVLPRLREQRPLCKMIWEGYYRDLTTELLNRIIDNNQNIGIYKITNLIDKKVYIGQAVNLSERIKTHIKAGLGIDASNNEMYKIMQSIGIENFSFEILEYCSAQELNDRERFWIDYYQSQTFGYNQTRGGATYRK